MQIGFEGVSCIEKNQRMIDKVLEGQFYFDFGISLGGFSEIKMACKYLLRSMHIFKMKFGEDHIRTRNANKKLTKNFVLLGINRPKGEYFRD